MVHPQRQQPDRARHDGRRRTDVFRPTPGAGPAGITAGPDGALWFTEIGANKIGRITTLGVVTNEFTVPTANSDPVFISVGPDGALWFTEQTGTGSAALA